MRIEGVEVCGEESEGGVGGEGPGWGVNWGLVVIWATVGGDGGGGKAEERKGAEESYLQQRRRYQVS